MPDLRPAIIAVNSTMMVLSLAAIACRVGRRIFLVRSFSWHDCESGCGAEEDVAMLTTKQL